jgi:hypothetical protein
LGSGLNICPNKQFNPSGEIIMTRIYRGISSEASAPIRLYPNSVETPQIKLFYRGNVFDYIPRPMLIAQKWWPTATFIYRGVTHERKIQPLKTYQKPLAINWRWNCD